MPFKPEHADRYRTQQPARRKSNGVIARADELVPIHEVLAAIGTHVPESISGSWKVRCPWGDEHKDGGVEQDCRVYASNSLHCFAMHGTMTPTTIQARAKGIGRQRAAIEMLEARGLLRGRDYRERWSIMHERRANAHTEFGNPAHVVQALQVRLSARPEYQEAEFEMEVIDAWQEQLKKLDKLAFTHETGLSKLRDWFDESLDKITASALTAVQHST